KLEEFAETAVPYLGGVSVGLKYASLSMEYIIGRANEKGRQSAQLHRYATAWAFRFFNDGYSPQMLAPLDEQMALMNTCSRLGVEDAVKTLEDLGSQAKATRQAAINHYGGEPTARENLVLELLKQAGAK